MLCLLTTALSRNFFQLAMKARGARKIIGKEQRDRVQVSHPDYALAKVADAAKDAARSCAP